MAAKKNREYFDCSDGDGGDGGGDGGSDGGEGGEDVGNDGDVWTEEVVEFVYKVDIRY